MISGARRCGSSDPDARRMPTKLLACHLPCEIAPVMSTKQTLLDRELFVHALRHMGEEDLRYLNRMVVERLNLLAQARSTVQLAQFAEGDRVCFTTNDGSVKRALVLRLNKKTASLLTDDGQNWKVSPMLLRKATGT
jgi:hypothetical protein